MARKRKTTKRYSKPRHFLWRDGRPRWEPSPTLRRLGFSGVDLKDGSGAWLSEGDAITRANTLNEDADRRRLNQPAPKRPPAKKTPRACAALWSLYTSSSWFTDLAPDTQDDYANKARVFLEGFTATEEQKLDDGLILMPGDHIPGFAADDVRAIDKPAMFTFAEILVHQKSRAMAHAIMAVVRRMFSYGEAKGWRPDNPATRLGIGAPAPRVVTYEPAEVALLVQTADTYRERGAGFQSIGDAFVLAIHQGQREGDTLRLPDAVAETGRMDVRQSKRGALISVKLTRRAHCRMREALARKREAGLSATALIVNERTGRPYADANQFGKRFRKVRAEACTTLIMAEEEGAAYRLFNKTFQDTRDTYLTRSHAAGNDAKRRAAVSGHDERTQVENEAHYIAVAAEQADEAQDALEAWMDEQGIAI